MVHDGPATWNSHKQTTVTHSPTDTEYMAISDVSREAIVRIQFFQELNISSAPILILADSNTALTIANGEAITHRKAKYIDIKYVIIFKKKKSQSIIFQVLTISQTSSQKHSARKIINGLWGM